MGLALPKIVYPSGGGNTLNFTRQPRMVPYDVRKAVRHDNDGSSGVRESIYERTDIFLQFTMEYVNIGADIAAWDSFIQNAEQGNSFDYYVDGTLTPHTTYTLQGTDWTAKFKQLGLYTFDMVFRLYVGWP